MSGVRFEELGFIIQVFTVWLLPDILIVSVLFCGVDVRTLLTDMVGIKIAFCYYPCLCSLHIG